MSSADIGGGAPLGQQEPFHPTQPITPFLFEGENLVRVIERDGAPWFVAKDVCGALGIQWKRADTVSGLDPDEKGAGITGSPGGDQEVLIVSESGLYALIFRSRKPEAVRFRKWVTSEVLPALRRTGQYRAAPAPTQLPPGTEEDVTLLPIMAKMRIVEGYRRTYGVRVARRIGLKLKLPVVVGMEEAVSQPDFWDGDEEEAA